MRERKEREIDPIDRNAGAQLRLLRLSNGISLEAVAKVLGVQWQQIQKLEKGETKFTATKIWKLADHYAVSVQYFFEGCERLNSTSATIKDLTPTELTEDSIRMAKLMGALPLSKQKALLATAAAMGDE